MIIRIAPRVLALAQWHPLLDTIVSLLEQPHIRHSVDPAQVGEIEASAWLADARGYRGSTLELLKRKAGAVAREVPSDAVTLVVDDRASLSGEIASSREIRAHPYCAITLLCHPLYLIVEDEVSDGSFVLWMARLLGREVIQNSYNNGRLLFRHAGGKGQIGKSAKALTYGVWPREQRPILSLKLRALALLDSDARFPGDQQNASIIIEVSEHVVFVHQLGRRSIENYVPTKYFRRRLAADGQGGLADAYFRMTDEQQSHFPIKRGFVDKTEPPQPQSQAAFKADVGRSQAERDLFGTVDAADWPHLAVGFGERLANVYQDPAYRCNASEEGQMSKVPRAELNGFLTKVIQYL